MPIQLNFEMYQDISPEEFYHCLKKDIQTEIENRQLQNDAELHSFLKNTDITSHIEMREFNGNLFL